MANHARPSKDDDLLRSAARSSELIASRNKSRRSEDPYSSRRESWNDNSDTGRIARQGTIRDEARSGSSRGRYGSERPPRQDAVRNASSNPYRTANRASRQPQSQQNPQSLGSFVKRNSAYILSVVAVIVIVAAMIVFLHALAPEPEPANSSTEATYVCPYDWTKLDRSGPRFAYVVDGQVKSRTGIDVSENQQEIDWNAVAEDGIDFAIVRLGYRGTTEGTIMLDDRYEENIENAQRAGLDCGVYFFSQATTVEEAIEEADFVLKNLNGRKLEYPIAFDSEELTIGGSEPRTAGIDNETMTAIAEAFCERVEAAGYKSMVYGNSLDLSRYRYTNMQKHTIWWAEFNAPTPAARIDIAIWQYSNNGNVAGIETAVDLNIDLTGALE